MAVYIDNANIKFRNMIMCHMIADTEEELSDMANLLELKYSYWQFKGTYRSHFDISLSKKEKALKNGAIEISIRELGRFLIKKKKNI